MKRTNIRKWTMAAVVALCSMGLATQASALAIGDQFYLGSVIPDGGSEETQAEQITFLVGLAPNTTDTDTAQPTPNDYVRSSNVLCFPTCPAATDVDSVKDDTGGNDGDFGDGFTYLKAKYGNSAEVWYVADLTGDFELPGSTDQGGLSHWVLFNPSPSVAEPSVTLLLGLALTGVAFFGRKFQART